MAKKPGLSRLWTVPLAITRGPGEALEGADLLLEFPNDEDLALLLWCTMRDVVLWAGASAEARKRLFSDASGNRRLARLAQTEIPAAISASIDTINGMLTVPGRADGSVVAICCLEVSAWARREKLVHTAIAFAQAGALASPDFAEAALHTAIATAAAGQKSRAKTWLRRTIGLARRDEDRATYATAVSELATLYEGQGDTARAVYLYRWAYRAGRRYKVRSVRFAAAYGLFRISRAQGRDGAAQFASAIQRAFRPHLLGGLAAVLDVARFWVDQGNLDQARVALRQFSVGRGELACEAQLLSWALTARAFAGQEVGLATRAATEAWLLMGDTGISEAVRLTAAVDLAYAARSSGSRAAFRRAKREALRLAPTETFHQCEDELAAVWPEGVLPQSGGTS
jgi:hypothetical protein